MDLDSGHSAEELMLAVEDTVRFVRLGTTAGGLSRASSSLLNRLHREGPQRLTELARAENVSQPNMTQVVSRMEKAGLVRRVPDESDGRGVLVESTAEGRRTAEQRQTERASALQQLLEALSEPELEAVRIALPALARAVRDHADG
ncbi:MarR family winged helix-turn-helix transcriptional regulator [Streptomyces sp. NPDC057694]|uniref:MarR family winged helix-turn-helix transcriptional regulator n=1 Tax=unclassified Streptomyces TaxID=2593676 RepID=UPI0036C6DAD7